MNVILNFDLFHSSYKYATLNGLAGGDAIIIFNIFIINLRPGDHVFQFCFNCFKVGKGLGRSSRD